MFRSEQKQLDYSEKYVHARNTRTSRKPYRRLAGDLVAKKYSIIAKS
jgi:hypothetical protein